MFYYFVCSFSSVLLLCIYIFSPVAALSHSVLFISPRQHCSGCGQPAALDSPVVYAERAGYERLWHPTCFVCVECNEALVDLVYFWRKDTLLCGRHYCQGLKPRCPGCDEVIAFPRTD